MWFAKQSLQINSPPSVQHANLVKTATCCFETARKFGQKQQGILEEFVPNSAKLLLFPYFLRKYLFRGQYGGVLVSINLVPVENWAKTASWRSKMVKTAREKTARKWSKQHLAVH